MKEKEKRKEDIMMARCFSKGMARWLSTHLVTYAVTALAPGHMAFTDASKDNNNFWGAAVQLFAALLGIMFFSWATQDTRPLQ